MSKKKYFISLAIAIVLCISAFSISYIYGLGKLKSSNEGIRKPKVNLVSANNKSISIFNTNEIIDESTKITLKTLFKKSGEEMTTTLDSKKLQGKGKKDLEELGYSVEKISKTEVVLQNSLRSYSPNKYVIDLTEDKYLAIFRTGEDGSEYLEDESEDVTDKKMVKDGDIAIYDKGSKEYQFDTKSDAKEYLENNILENYE